MKSIISWIGSLFALLILIVLLNYEITSINNIYLKILWHNLKFISSAVYTLVPLLLLFALLLLLFTNKWSLRVEKLSIGGFNIIFDNPNNLFKRQVRNYLDTKRTVFKIDLNRDNFKETLDSYYEVYRYFREEIKIFGNVKKGKLMKTEKLTLYNLANQAIFVLNEFLTEHQSNYRRWYTYIEKTDEGKFYLTPIGQLQKQYFNYEKMCSDFEEVNEFFINKIAGEFDIDINKWGIEKTQDEDHE